MEKSLLKEKLKEIEKDNFRVPGNADAFGLAMSMTEYIGDLDAELRDELVYSTFSKWIIGGVFTADQLKTLLALCLDKSHMFYRIGGQGEDSVFTRSFSALITGSIIYYHRQHNFLTSDELKTAKDKLVRYMLEEKDVRGYVEGKGWAHSAAHTADVLDELALCEPLESVELLEILQAVKSKVCISCYAYVNEEDERMATPVVNIIKRNVLDKAAIINWVNSFQDIRKTRVYPEYHNLIMNTKNFLRSVYFRLLYEKDHEVICEALKETLFRIKSF